MKNVVRCKYFEAGAHNKNPTKNSYQDGLGRTTQTLDHVVVIHTLIWDKKKSQINEYSDKSHVSWTLIHFTTTHVYKFGASNGIFGAHGWLGKIQLEWCNQRCDVFYYLYLIFVFFTYNTIWWIKYVMLD